MQFQKTREQALADRRKEFDQRRPTAKARGYDGAWRKLRDDFLMVNPICCRVGCSKPATDADHIYSVATHPGLRLVWGNLRPFCHEHHSQRTAREQGFAKRKE